MKPTLFWLAVMAVLTLSAPGQTTMVSGRVVDSRTNHGIGNLTVVVQAPASSSPVAQSSPQRVVLTTDKDGGFSTGPLAPGRYLIGVSEGPDLLYRKVVVVPQDASLIISLQPK
jgi:hypothetical protein